MEMTLKRKRTKAEPGCAAPLESEGKINLITSKWSECRASSLDLQRGCSHRAKLPCVSNCHTPWSCEKEITEGPQAMS